MAPTNGTDVGEETVHETRTRRRREARIESHRQRANHDKLLTEFQPDAVEIEQRPIPLSASRTLYVVLGLITSFIIWANWAAGRQDRHCPGNAGDHRSGGCH